MSLTHDLQFAGELARLAGGAVLQHYGKVKRLTKTHAAASAEAVTDADRASQRLIVQGLRRRFPGDGIIGEENETGDAITFDCPNPQGRNWVIDPIDGTNNFIAGLGNFAICIGLLEAGMPVLGVVYDVARDMLYSAAKGEGAWQGSKRLTALQTPLGDHSMIMLTSNLLGPQGRCPQWAQRMLSQNIWKIRILGSAALEAAYVAAGVAHAAFTVNGKLWDVTAPAALLMEAGAILTDPQGRPIFPFGLKSYSGAKVPFIAAAPTAHPALLREVRNHP